MLDKFNVESRYKFSKELFIEDCRKHGDRESDISRNLEWANEIDGRVVSILNEDDGIIDIYDVAPEWCEEIKDRDVFEEGKKYVFKKELLLETIKDSFDEELRNIVLGGWADDINGKVVDVIDSTIGYASFYSVLPEWCEEIIEKKVFDENREYKFSKELFIKDCKKDGDSKKVIKSHLNTWANEIDNCVIHVLGESTGVVYCYGVIPEWCVEITDGVDR